MPAYDSKLKESYYKYLNKRVDTETKALQRLIDEVVKEERESTPIQGKKRQLMQEMYPHIKVLCLDNISVLVSHLQHKSALMKMGVD